MLVDTDEMTWNEKCSLSYMTEDCRIFSNFPFQTVLNPNSCTSSLIVNGEEEEIESHSCQTVNYCDRNWSH